MPPAPPPTLQEQKTPPARWYRNPWIIFAVALALRAALIFNFHLASIPSKPHHHFSFGWEMGRVASAIASGRGYADPFFGHTGPTAWVPPLYPYLMAGVFRLFGIYTAASALTLLLLNALFGALTIFPIRDIASRCFSTRLAVAAAWFWAVWPFSMRYLAHLRDPSLTALLFTTVIALTIRMRGIGNSPASRQGADPTLPQWLLLGLLWGLIALTNPAPILCLPVCFLWILFGIRARQDTAQFRRQFRQATLAVLLCIACIAPWTIRNAIVFHKFIPMRSDLGEELYQGNGPGSQGISMVWEHPYDSPHQYNLYRSMGEVAYCHMRGRKAIAFIRQHPAHFVIDSLRRFHYFWLGFPQASQSFFLDYAPTADVIFISVCGFFGLILALRRRVPGAGLFEFILLFYPLAFYFIIVESHHRFPIDPLLYILTVYLWTSAEEGYRIRLLSPSWWRSRFAPQA